MVTIGAGAGWQNERMPSTEPIVLNAAQARVLGALMENMDGDEDGPDPEWGERRWR